MRPVFSPKACQRASILENHRSVAIFEPFLIHSFKGPAITGDLLSYAMLQHLFPLADVCALAGLARQDSVPASKTF